MSEQQDVPTSRTPRFLQVSIKMMFGLILVIGLALGWWVSEARKQAAAVALISKDRPYAVRYEGQNFSDYGADKQPDAKAKPWWPPAFLERWLGPDMLRNVVEVNLDRSYQPDAPNEDELLAVTIPLRRLKILRIEFDVSDAQAELLTHLSALEDLAMPQGNKGLTDRGMQSIGSILTLKTLHLNHTSVTSAGLAELGNLDRLESLSTANMVFVQDANGVSIRGPSTTDWSPGLAALTKLPRLMRLDLSLPYVDGVGLSQIGKMRSLKMLEINSLSCVDDDLRHLATLMNLQVLSLAGTTIDGTGFRNLSGLSQLAQVIVQDAPRLADPIVAALVKLPSLEMAMLDGSHLTTDGLIGFRAASRLRFLRIEPEVADEVSKLQKALPRCQVQNGPSGSGGASGYTIDLK